ncbi:MAG: sensor histidine kinase [Persicimonas sp.]
MFGRRSRRRGFPGGLRAQLLLGLLVLLTVGFSLVAAASLHVFRNQLQRAEAERVEAAAGEEDRQPDADSLTSVEERVEQTRGLLFVFFGLDALFILIMGYAFLTFVVVRPVRALGVASERAARGDLASPVTVLPPNEFGQVGRQFNQMLSELRENREQLEERLEELDRANQKLRATRDSLIRSEKLASVGELAAGVAHEVGNPLAAISGYLELLEDEEIDEETRVDMVERSQSEVERIRTIIRDLLDYSREDDDPQTGSVDLSKCVEEAINLVGAQPRARSVDIGEELPEELPPVDAVDSQVVQVLVNLLINAVDAVTREEADVDEPSVRITAEANPDGSEVVLAVEDNGPGIASEDRQRVFDPFYTTKEPGEGTGLGLAICLRIMRRVDGDIRIEENDGGARFELVFEAARSEADRENQTPDPS